MKKTSVVVIPVYNEVLNLKILLPKILVKVPNCEIIVVDDNSSDNTQEIIKKINKNHRITHLIRSKKMGRGTAVIHGFSYAFKNTKAEVFVEMDADLSHDPSELNNLINNVNDNTIAIASRYLKGSRIVNSPTYRRLLSRMANTLNALLFWLPIADNTNGYRAYPRRAIELLINYKFKSTGFVTISESTYFLYKKGFDLSESKTVFVNRRLGGSKANLHEIYISFRDLVRIRFSKTGR